MKPHKISASHFTNWIWIQFLTSRRASGRDLTVFSISYKQKFKRIFIWYLRDINALSIMISSHNLVTLFASILHNSVLIWSSKTHQSGFYRGGLICMYIGAKPFIFIHKSSVSQYILRKQLIYQVTKIS